MSETETEISQTTAGELLQQLRKQKELSVQDVSEKIHLEPRIIEALEANNFDILPAATYARGYLRSYAKLLGADADEIITLYNNNAPAAPEIIPEVKHPTQTSSTDKPVKAFSYLITLILVLLVVAWWQSDFVVDSSTRLNDTAKDSEVASNDANEPEDDAQADVVAVETESLEPEDRSATDTVDNLINVATASTAGEISETGSEHQEALMTAAASTELDSDAASDNNPQEQDLTTDEDDPIDRRGEGPDEISITLSADSWVEVFEADGDKLYLNLARSGKTLILRGTQPFSVLLGFSQGAIVTFNDEQIDHAPYSRSGIARFWVSSEGASIRE